MSSKRRKLSHHEDTLGNCLTDNLSSKQVALPSSNGRSTSGSGIVPDDLSPDVNGSCDNKRRSVFCEDSCPICLQDVNDPAVTYPCNHVYDFECIRRWVDQTRTCPLCKTGVQCLLYDIDKPDHRKYYPPEKRSDVEGARSIGEIRRRRREQEQNRRFQRRSLGGSSDVSLSDLDVENEIALKRRKFVYSNKLYASHVGTNRHSNFASFTTKDIADNKRNLKRKATMFIRRELQVFPFLTGNLEFSLQYLVEGVLTRMDIQSEGALKLVSDILGSEYAGLFLHELRTFLRSPFETLRSFDQSMLIQYAEPLRPAWEQSASKD